MNSFPLYITKNRKRVSVLTWIHIYLTSKTSIEQVWYISQKQPTTQLLVVVIYFTESTNNIHVLENENNSIFKFNT